MRITAEDVPGDAGLGVDYGDVVGKNVVQFAGAADAFGGDLAVGLGLPAVLSDRGSLFGGKSSDKAAIARQPSAVTAAYRTRSTLGLPERDALP
jgi:hypothetical protein